MKMDMFSDLTNVQVEGDQGAVCGNDISGSTDDIRGSGKAKELQPTVSCGSEVKYVALVANDVRGDLTAPPPSPKKTTVLTRFLPRPRVKSCDATISV